MGLKTSLLPDNILRRIPREQRAPLGKAGVTNAEAQQKRDQRAERLLQRDMENLLRQRNIFFSRSRMDKRPTIRKGLFDFSIVMPGGRFLAVEAKVQGGVISDDQKRCFDEFWSQTGGVVHIIFNLDTFKELLDAHSK